MPRCSIERLLHEQEVMRAHGLAAIGLGPLGRLIDIPVDNVVQAVQCIAGDVDLVFLKRAFGLAADKQHFHGLAAGRPLFLLCFLSGQCNILRCGFSRSFLAQKPVNRATDASEYR